MYYDFWLEAKLRLLVSLWRSEVSGDPFKMIKSLSGLRFQETIFMTTKVKKYLEKLNTKSDFSMAL